jgi:cysteine-rich repeat protein/parallel beta-helix repeat protein
MLSFYLTSAASLYNITKVSSTEYRVYYNNTHFLSILNPNGAFAIRTHPGLDPNGWGSTLYLDPFLPGATISGTTISSITANSTAVKVIVNGKVSKSTSSSYGTWSSTLVFTFNQATRTVNGKGIYSISLSGSLSNSTGDLNLYKIASNYLDDVPLLDGTVGDTGDMNYANITGTNFKAVWNPSFLPGYFPTNQMTTLTVDVVGQYNNVDTAAQGYAPIKPAYKPSIKVTLSPYSILSQAPINFGGFYDTSKSKQFWQDNVGITPLVLKKSTMKSFKFNIAISSTPIAGDANWNKTVTCYKDLDCGIPIIYPTVCSGNNVVHNISSYTCNNAGTLASSCTLKTTQETIEQCSGYCADSSCQNYVCTKDSDCGTNFYSNNFCSSNNLVQNYTQFKCNSPSTPLSSCSNSLSQILVSTCSLGCLNNQCNQQNCGNGIKEGLEQCDDGNLINGDGCSSQCKIEISNCVTPTDGMNLTSNTTLCKGTYNLPNGIWVRNFNSTTVPITLDCAGAKLIGDKTKAGIAKGPFYDWTINNYYQLGPIVVKNCEIINYSEGIYIFHGYNDVFSNNIISSTWIGANFDNSFNETLKGNTFTNNNLIMELYWGSSNFTITTNTFKNNYYGFYLGGNYNKIYQNNMIDTNITVESNSTSTTIWNTATKGNYWSDYDTSAEGCLDANSNGICDSPYTKSANLIDYYPSVKMI